jgi:hypothetical protein
MDGVQFEQLLRTLATSRRSYLGGALALGAILARQPATSAKKRGRKRRPKVGKPNAYGCLNVGAFCKNSSQCCSGICSGKKRKRKCQAVGQGTCAAEVPGVCHPVTPLITICNNARCWCARTTGGAPFCANSVGTVSCDECRTDTDCVSRGFPAGSACVPWDGGLCGGPCAGKAVCLLPCGVDLPEQAS